MLKTTDYTNWDAPDADYPEGKARNETLSVLGTEWNAELMNDLFMAILKACRDTGLNDSSKNGLPDNETNGYQLFNAIFGFEWKEVGNDGGLTSFTNGASSSTGPLTGGRTIRYTKFAGGKMLHIEGWYGVTSSDDQVAFTLPVGYRPNQGARFNVVRNDGGMYVDQINSDGQYLCEDGIIGGRKYVNITLPLT